MVRNPSVEVDLSVLYIYIYILFFKVGEPEIFMLI